MILSIFIGHLIAQGDLYLLHVQRIFVLLIVITKLVIGFYIVRQSETSFDNNPAAVIFARISPRLMNK